jgi:hypothetical protein
MMMSELFMKTEPVSPIISVHEAGHAIVALSLNLQVQEIFVDSNPPKVIRTTSDIQEIEKIVKVAGVVAVALCSSDTTKFDMNLLCNGAGVGGKVDLRQAKQIETTMMIEQACECAWDILVSNRKMLDNLSKELLEKQHLKNADITFFSEGIKKFRLLNNLDEEDYAFMCKNDKFIKQI